MAYVALLVLGLLLIVSGVLAAVGAVLVNPFGSQRSTQSNLTHGMIVSGILLTLGVLALVLGARGL